jgi:hypothetical protein
MSSKRFGKSAKKPKDKAAKKAKAAAARTGIARGPAPKAAQSKSTHFQRRSNG